MASGDLGLPSSVPPAMANQARRVEPRLRMATSHHRHAHQGESGASCRLTPVHCIEG